MRLIDCSMSHGKFSRILYLILMWILDTDLAVVLIWSCSHLWLHTADLWPPTQLIFDSQHSWSLSPHNSSLAIHATRFWISTTLISGFPHSLSLARHMAYLWLTTWLICDSTHGSFVTQHTAGLWLPYSGSLAHQTAQLWLSIECLDFPHIWSLAVHTTHSWLTTQLISYSPHTKFISNSPQSCLWLST